MIRGRSPDVVTVSVGGNDVGFVNVINTCYLSDCDDGRTLGTFTRLESNCASLLDCIAARSRCPADSRVESLGGPNIPERTHFVAYPNLTRGDNGLTCGEAGNSRILGDLPGDVNRSSISAPEAKVAEKKVLVRLNRRIHAFADSATVGFIAAHATRSFRHGYCAEGRWFRTYRVAGQRQEEVVQAREVYGLIKVGVAPGTLHPNAVGTDAIERAIADSAKSDLTRSFPTLRRQYP